MHDTQESLVVCKKSTPIDKAGNPLKPCCACPETRAKRDDCILLNGEENCVDLIQAHKDCLRNLGFNI